MPNGSVNITLRPIKLAFLVNPNDKNTILEAIQINTFLWGGIYNPLIPVYKRTPPGWDVTSKRKSYKDVINGYIDTYDPDFIVNVSNLNEINYIKGTRKVINSDDVYAKDKDKSLIPRYGLSIIEVMNQFIEDELKFIRKYPYKLITLKNRDKFSLFLKSVFGCLNDKINKIFLEYYKEYYPFDIKECGIDNFGEYLKNEYQFLRRISEKYIKHVRTRGAWRSDCVFILDAKSNLDIIDYWNLRAIGWRILPLPNQSTEDSELFKNISNFIDSNYYPINNQGIYNETTILKSRSISQEEFKKTLETLKSKLSENQQKPQYVVQSWYPRIWDDWAREKDNVEFCIIESETKSIELPNKEDRINFNNLKPVFAKHYWRENPQFANEIELNVYSTENELYAKVIPEGNDRLIHAFNTYLFNEWRFSRNGIVFLSKHNKENINIKLPKAREIFIKWLEEKKYNPIISDSGRLVEQMIKYIGGTWDLTFLANEPTIKLLIDLRNGKTLTEKKILQLLSRLHNDDKNNEMRKRTIETLCRLKIIQSGFEIKCPTCLQKSWYSLKDMNYNLNCPKCYENFQFYLSTHSDINLSFKSLGPFNFTEKNYGVLSELLTLRFFSNTLQYPSTIIFGFKLTNEIEIDLGILLQGSYMGDRNIKVLFAECKMFNEFQKTDVKRLNIVASKFPGCILVFSTLKDKLTKREIKLLTPLVKKEHKNRQEFKPYNSVLILTGVELFSQHFEPPYCWKDLGGKYDDYYTGKKFFNDLDGLCKATQDIYLNLEPVSEVTRWTINKGNIGKIVL